MTVKVRTHTKIGEIAPEVPSEDDKTCFVLFFFSVTNTTRTFGHLSCTDYEHFGNKDLNRCAVSFGEERTHEKIGAY